MITGTFRLGHTFTWARARLSIRGGARRDAKSRIGMPAVDPFTQRRNDPSLYARRG